MTDLSAGPEVWAHKVNEPDTSGQYPDPEAIRQKRIAELGGNFKIMRHRQNQHGWGVSLIKYRIANDPVSLESGFTLISCKSEVEQQKYISELADITNLEIEDGF